MEMGWKMKMEMEKNGFTLHNHETILCWWVSCVGGLVGFLRLIGLTSFA